MDNNSELLLLDKGTNFDNKEKFKLCEEGICLGGIWTYSKDFFWILSIVIGVLSSAKIEIVGTKLRE